MRTMEQNNEIKYEKVRGHIEVYKGNKFLFSADTTREADEELESMDNHED